MTDQTISPAYRIETERMVFRCWDPTDAPALTAAITDSLTHLRAWMPWAKDEPKPVSDKVEQLRRHRSDFDSGQRYIYGVFDPDERAVVGETWLNTYVGKGGLSIGYWIHVDHINQGRATEIVAALTKAAFEIHAIDRIEIHCDPANTPSAKIPEKLGYQHEATLKRRHYVWKDQEPGDLMIWTLFRSDYPNSPASAAKIKAYDVMGKQIL